MKTIKVLFVGDVVGPLGCAMFQKHIGHIKREYAIDAVVVNGENSNHNGRGINERLVNFFKHNGADIITTGNHIWAQKDVYDYLSENNDLLRPANFPAACPGVGATTFNVNGVAIGVMNIQGRIFMREFVECPFRTAESILTFLKSKTKLIFVDFHAEATSEKVGMGLYLDGKVTGVVGTHTHIQTADERILPGGTAFITDLGMVGALNSMIGMKKESIMRNMLTQMPSKFEVDINPPAVLSGVIIEADVDTGKAINIIRLRIIDENIHVE